MKNGSDLLLPAREGDGMESKNVSVNKQGHLTFAGFDTVDLAQKYGTPLYLMDEDRIRENIRFYKRAVEKYFPAGSYVSYAGKAFACKQMYRLAKQEGICADAVSPGEIYTAASAGFDCGKIFFHGNNKTDEDIRFAVRQGVGGFVADSIDEISAIDGIAGNDGSVQKILLRITPDIDAHTHKKISTGTADSKFGIPMAQAEQAVNTAAECKNIKLCGFHYHIGSQIFDAQPFMQAAKTMCGFVKETAEKTGYAAQVLDIGGGFGVRYTSDAPNPDIDKMLREIADVINSEFGNSAIKTPAVVIEPGRSITADAGMTLYTVGSVKKNGTNNYVSVDGGMTDNPRYTLYEAPYTVIIANKADCPKDFTATLAGRCCESGDIIQKNVYMPQPVREDIVAVLTTGAYNYSMASNYNRVCRPPVVMLTGGKDYIAVRRETMQDICALDI